MPTKVRLTPREQEVALLVAQGLSNREIAHRLSITEETVNGYLKSITQKTGLHGRVRIAVWTALHLQPDKGSRPSCLLPPDAEGAGCPFRC